MKLRKYLQEEVLNEMAIMTDDNESVDGYKVVIHSLDHFPPHCHLEGKKEYKVAITVELPKSYEDIRFIEDYGYVSNSLKKAIFEWFVSKPFDKEDRLIFDNNWLRCKSQLRTFRNKNFLSIDDKNLYKC